MFVSEPTLDVVIRGLILTALGMTWVVILVRINGLRSFSKMTNFDFVMTVAVGSLLAGGSQSTSWHAYVQTLAATAGLFLVQAATAKLRTVSNAFESLMQNKPVILMRDGHIIDAGAETPLPDGPQEPPQLFQIGFAQGGRIGHQCGHPLQSPETGHSLEGEFELVLIENMEDHHFMLFLPEAP